MRAVSGAHLGELGMDSSLDICDLAVVRDLYSDGEAARKGWRAPHDVDSDRDHDELVVGDDEK